MANLYGIFDEDHLNCMALGKKKAVELRDYCNLVTYGDIKTNRIRSYRLQSIVSMTKERVKANKSYHVAEQNCVSRKITYDDHIPKHDSQYWYNTQVYLNGDQGGCRYYQRHYFSFFGGEKFKPMKNGPEIIITRLYAFNQIGTPPHSASLYKDALRDKYNIWVKVDNDEDLARNMFIEVMMKLTGLRETQIQLGYD